MSAQAAEPDDLPDDLDDLPDDLDEELEQITAPKKGAKPLTRTPKQRAAAEAAEEKAAAEVELAAATSAAAQQAAVLAQIVNLHIAGHSLSAIGAAIGATADEVDRMLSTETQRYVRNQPALRTYVRNFISSKYSEMLESVFPQATDPSRKDQLEYFDRAQRVLAQMGRLHGAEAPTQTEVKVEAKPESVEKMVAALASGQGLGYDPDVFDLDEDDVHEIVESSHVAEQVSGNAVEQPQEGEPTNGF